jgi:hypothetical protein
MDKMLPTGGVILIEENGYVAYYWWSDADRGKRI